MRPVPVVEADRILRPSAAGRRAMVPATAAGSAPRTNIANRCTEQRMTAGRCAVTGSSFRLPDRRSAVRRSDIAGSTLNLVLDDSARVKWSSPSNRGQTRGGVEQLIVSSASKCRTAAGSTRSRPNGRAQTRSGPRWRFRPRLAGHAVGDRHLRKEDLTHAARMRDRVIIANSARKSAEV